MYIVLAGIVLFFALTRTEVGREGLRLEIERQFADRFDGEIEIGRLSGNLMNRLSAGDVTIRDPSGRVVIAVDSVVAYPRWRDLFRRTVTTGSVTLIRPKMRLTRSADGTWNLASVFRGRDRHSDAAPWSFHSTGVTIVDGRIVTRSIGERPRAVADGAVFDYADAEAIDLHGRAIVEWTDDLKLIDVLALQGRIPDLDLPIETLRGQFLVQDERLALNEVHLHLGESRLYMAGSVSSHVDLLRRPSDAVVDIDLRSSRLRAAELTRIFPRLPVSDEVNASLRAQGPLSGLVVEDLQLSRGRSNLSAEGTLLGLPDSLDYELAFRPSALTSVDVEAVLPGVGLPDFAHLGRIQFSGFSDGIIRYGDRGERPVWQATSDVQTTSRAGRLDAALTTALGGHPRFAVDGSVRTHDFDLGLVTRRTGLQGALNGEATLSASGADLMDVTGVLTASLSRSRIAGRFIDTLRIDLTGDRGRVSGRMRAAQGTGRVLAAVDVDLDSFESSYRIDGALANYDVGRLLLSDSLQTSLNLTFRVDGRGNTPRDFQGILTLDFDESRVAHGVRNRVVPAHRTRATIRQVGAASPLLEITGDVISMRMTGDVAIEPLISLGRHWQHAFRRWITRASGRPLAADSSTANSPDAGGALDEVLYSEGHTDGQAGLHRADIGEHSIAAELRIKRADIVSALLPTLPAVQTDLEANVDLTFDWNRFAFDLSASADTIDTQSVRARNADLTLAAEGSLADLRRNAIEAHINSSADRLYAGGQTFVSPTFIAGFHDGGLDVDLVSTASGAAAPLRLTGRLDVLSDRARMRIQTLQLAAREQVWEADSAHAIDIFRDGVAVRELTVRRTDPQAAGTERLRLWGTVSPSTSDSLEVDVRDIPLRDVMNLLAVERPLGGVLNGRLAYAGYRQQPELTGSIRVDSLTYDNRVLGALRIDSRYIPGSPDVGLSLGISPLEPSDTDDRRFEPNDLRVTGTFRLPGTDAAGRRDDGALDLDVESRMLNGFFLAYVFQNEVSDVHGFFRGSGSIEGSFARPLFYASLELEDGAFRVPDFNLDYEASGQVRVDELGIHLEDVAFRDPRNGRADVNGSILFNEYRYFSFDLHGRLNDLRIMNVSQSRELPFYGRISASGDMSLTGPLSSAMLRSTNAVTSAESDLFIPITETSDVTDAGFIVFADSVGQVPDLRRLARRENLLAERPASERPFLEALEMDLNITAPDGSTVHLVIDPLLGDVINAVGSGRIQLLRTEGEFFTYGRFNVDSGDYLFTAGEVFFRRFLIDDGSISWDGDPLNASLNIQAAYRTRASTEGLTDACGSSMIPLVIRMNVVGRVATPNVELALAIDRDSRSLLAGCAQGLEAELNEPELTAQYATSVLLTNSFLLTTSSIGSEPSQGLTDTRNQLAFNSLSQLVASQLNRYLNYALPNLDLSLGLLGESTQDLDVTYGVALRLLDERLIIRGQGIYQNEPTDSRQQSGLDEFVVEIRLNSSVSVEVFYRREGLLQTTETLSTNTTGAGLSYQTQFASWRRLMHRLFGWMLPGSSEEVEPDESDEPEEDVVAGADDGS